MFECLSNQICLVFLLPHTSHICQPTDLGPFAQMKRYYSQYLKEYISTGETKVTRAQFNTLFNHTREVALSREYIEVGWRRTGLHPFNPRRVLLQPKLVQYRQTTPDLAPPQSSIHRTP